jgi:hypothetical protein
MIGLPVREPRAGLPGVGSEGMVLLLSKRYDNCFGKRSKEPAAMTTPILTAIAEQDRDALRELLAEDVRFNSPVRSYTGRDEVVHLLATIGSLQNELRAVRSITFLEFGKLDGVLHESSDADGRVSELTLMLRPLGPLLKVVEEMGKALEAG